MNYYENQWKGKFGNKYTDRCPVEWKPRIAVFDKLLSGLNIESVLEVGCNLGHNLLAINAVTDADVFGIDINQYAINKSDIKPCLKKASIFNTGFDDNTFDLVLSAGVLIHQHAAQLSEAMLEIHRVSKKYILLIEYPNTEEVGRHYRDFQDKEGVWSRPYGEIFQGLTGAKLLRTGHMKDISDEKWGFSKDCDWWLFRK